MGDQPLGGLCRNAWAGYTFMHADYFAANQPVFNDGLLDLCLRNNSDNVLFVGPRYSVPPGSQRTARGKREHDTKRLRQ